jgi:flagellar FliL protein
MAEQEDFEIDETAKPGGKKKLIIIVAALVLLIGGGAAAYFMMSSSEDDAEDGEAAEEAVEEVKPAVYQSFDAPLVVNFEKRGPVKLLQADVEVMARDEATIEAFKLHRPMIRNNLMLLLAQQDYQEISTVEGKEKLRQAMLNEINKVLKERGSEQGVEQVFFTKFVMQ